MAVKLFERPFDYTPGVTKKVVEGEPHTIPTSPPHDIYLHHIPREGTVVIPGYTEVDGTPGAGQFRVHYTEQSGAPRGRITFSEADAGKSVAVNYHACGTLIWAEDRGDGRPNIAELQEVLERVQEAGGIDYSSSVAGFSPADVAAALDALAGVRMVESGSNANGSYWRWENGLQIATSWCLGRGNGVDDWASAPFTWAAAFTQLAALVAIPTGVRDDRDPTGPFDVAAWATYFSLTYSASLPDALVFAQRGSPIASGRRVVAMIIGIGSWK